MEYLIEALKLIAPMFVGGALVVPLSEKTKGFFNLKDRYIPHIYNGAIPMMHLVVAFWSVVSATLSVLAGTSFVEFIYYEPVEMIAMLAGIVTMSQYFYKASKAELSKRGGL